MKASIIIPTLNRYEVLHDTISSLLAQKEYFSEIIIIDQSDKVSREFKDFASKHEEIKWIRQETPNLPKARNRGIDLAKEDIIVFLDDDVIPSGQLIKRHLSNLRDPEIGCSAGRVVTKKEKNIFSNGKAGVISKTGKIIPNPTSKVRDFINTAYGANMAFNKEALLKVGYFDTNFVGNAMREESDVSLRLIKSGYRILFDPEAEVIHLQAPAGGCRQKSRIDWYFDFFHNEYYFFLKHFPWYFRPIFFIRKLRPILACMFYYGKGKWKAIKTPFLAFGLAEKDFRSLN